MQPTEFTATWRGPFEWPRRRAKRHPVPKEPGVYLMCFCYADGFLIYGAGITRRPVPKRLSEHRRAWETGVYTALDMEALSQGVRKEIWHGFFMKRHGPEKHAEFAARKEEIVAGARVEMNAIRLFTACVLDGRIRARMEAAIMTHLWRQLPPFGTIPDRGVHLEPPLAGEPPIVMRNVCESKLHTLPELMEI